MSMSCHGICDIVNDSVCMGLCSAGLDKANYTIKQCGHNKVLTHPTLSQPITVVSDDEAKKIQQLKS
jgi:hypothetical protein